MRNPIYYAQQLACRDRAPRAIMYSMYTQALRALASRICLGIAMGWLLTASAHANENYQQNPTEVKAVFRDAAPVGTGVLRQMMLRAYEAAFWSQSGAWSMKEAHGLSLTYFWEIESADIIERTMREMRVVRPELTEEDLNRYEALLGKVIPKVYDGERITAIWDPKSKATAFYHNGKRTGIVPGAKFADAFFAIWLDEKTTAPELRAKLLKQ